MSVSAQMPAMTVCRLPRAPMAAAWSRRAAARSNCSSSAACSISAVSSRMSCLPLPSRSVTAWSIRRRYSSALMAERQKPSQRPMW